MVKQRPVITNMSNMNVINQGLFYLDWLVTHCTSGDAGALKTMKSSTHRPEWSSPRLTWQLL
jgi:hypothetical protein